MKKVFLFVLFVSSVLSACGSPEKSLQGTWTLTAYGPDSATAPTVQGSQASLTFNADGTIAGTSGCNSFGGEYKVDGDQVTFSKLVSTLMACDEPLMTQEGTIFKVLDGTASYKIDDKKLALTNNGLILQFTLAKAESYPSYPSYPR